MSICDQNYDCWENFRFLNFSNFWLQQFSKKKFLRNFRNWKMWAGLWSPSENKITKNFGFFKKLNLRIDFSFDNWWSILILKKMGFLFEIWLFTFRIISYFKYYEMVRFLLQNIISAVNNVSLSNLCRKSLPEIFSQNS